MTRWRNVDPDLADLIDRAGLTPKQADAFMLSLNGAGPHTIGRALGISREAARDRLRAARRRIAQALDEKETAA